MAHDVLEYAEQMLIELSAMIEAVGERHLARGYLDLAGETKGRIMALSLGRPLTD